MLNLNTILLLFETYHKLLTRQLKALKAFDLEAYLKMHPERHQLAREYQKTVSLLLETDLKKLKMSPDIKRKLQKLLRSIGDTLEQQKKMLFYAHQTQSRIADIHRNYAQRVTQLSTYGANGLQPQSRGGVVALSEML